MSLFEHGFITTDAEGAEVRLRWTGLKAVVLNGESDTWKTDPSESAFPADLMRLMTLVVEREEQVIEAVRVMSAIRQATWELGELLGNISRDEASLQNCLTKYPILFGLHYARIVPKYRLGKQYELDYALVQVGGRVDLVEIEASTHKLSTRDGNPRAALVHAEQQVLDWLDWLETNARMARDDLPGMLRPVGQIVIGRRGDLSTSDLARLRRRNATWQGSLVVLTYDDLLDRALNVLAILSPPEQV